MIEFNLQMAMAKARVRKLTDIWEATGISRTTLHGIITNKASGIQLGTLEKLCDFLGVRVEEIIEYKPEEKLKEDK